METEVSWLLVAVVGMVLTGSLLTWSAILGRWIRGRAALDAEPAAPVPWSLGHVLAIVVLFLLVQIALGSLLAARIPELPEQRTAHDIQLLLGASGLGNLIIATLGAIILVNHAQAGPADLGYPRSLARLARTPSLALFGFLAAATPVYLLQTMLTLWVEYKHPVVDMIFADGGLAVWVAAIFSAVVAAPIFEEFFFRLVLQGWLEKAFSRRTTVAGAENPTDITALPEPEPFDSEATPPVEASVADSENPYQPPGVATSQPEPTSPAVLMVRGWTPIVISSLLFALMHLGQGPAPIPLFVLALVLGYIFRQTHELLPCILMHALFNGFSLLVLRLSMSAQ